jgi:pyruvate formate lyase activating enzyme
MRSRITGVAGRQKNSFIDFPGTVSTVLFFSGCNLRCPYCHNPDIVNAGPDGMISSDDIWDFLEKRSGTIEGVVLSGGEPTLHVSLVDTVPAMKKAGYRVKLDTNGLIPGMIEALGPDYLALDVKCAPGLYQELLSSPYEDTAQRLVRSISIARAMGDNAEIRITVAPGIVDKKIIGEIGELVNGVKKIFLQPMRKRGPLLNPAIMEKELVSPEEISLYREILSEFAGECVIRGDDERVKAK